MADDDEEEFAGMTQAQKARAKLDAAKKKAEASKEEQMEENLTARQKAMQGLSKQGVVSRREIAGHKGESQHTMALKNLVGQREYFSTRTT